jgi:hypothetical protein
VLLSEIKSMVGSAVFDVVYADGDASLPRQMKAWATQGVSLLQAMVAAERADLMEDAPRRSRWPPARSRTPPTTRW